MADLLFFLYVVKREVNVNLDEGLFGVSHL